MRPYVRAAIAISAAVAAVSTLKSSNNLIIVNNAMFLTCDATQCWMEFSDPTWCGSGSNHFQKAKPKKRAPKPTRVPLAPSPLVPASSMFGGKTTDQ